MRIKKRQVEGQPLTVIIEYPMWSETVETLEKELPPWISHLREKRKTETLISAYPTFIISKMSRENCFCIPWIKCTGLTVQCRISKRELMIPDSYESAEHVL